MKECGTMVSPGAHPFFARGEQQQQQRQQWQQQQQQHHPFISFRPVGVSVCVISLVIDDCYYIYPLPFIWFTSLVIDDRYSNLLLRLTFVNSG